MQVITTHELASRTEAELAALFRAVSQALAGTDPETPERRNALASIENITRVRIARRVLAPAP